MGKNQVGNFFYSKLLDRLSRMMRLIKLGAPAMIVASELSMVLEAAYGFYGKELGAAMGYIEYEKALCEAKFCIHCGASGSRDGCCEACEKALEESFRAMEEEGDLALDPAKPSPGAPIH